MTECDFGAGECAAVATTVLKFARQEGHVHVCPTHERIDREYCAVVWSAHMVMSACPLCAITGNNPIGVHMPRLLADL